MNNLELKIAKSNEIQSLSNLSTENLIIWIIGKSHELNKTLTFEDIVIESWLINPLRYSLRKYNQFPDSSSIQKHIGAMTGKKGLLKGSMTSGYYLTEISKVKYADIIFRIDHKQIVHKKNILKSDRNLSSIDEAPYKRLIKTPAYKKFTENKLEQIVETDFLYFYGINWHSKKSFILNRFKNINLVVSSFSIKDPKLKELESFLNNKFQKTKELLIGKE